MEGSVRDLVGIGLQIAATFGAALAYILQKRAHGQHNAHSIYWNPLWQLGLVLMVVVAGIDVYSFSLLDQSKLAAFASVTICWNILLATLMLKEKFTRIDFASVVAISGGTILALSAGEATSKDFLFDEILGLLNDNLVIAYSSIVGVLVFVTALYIERVAKIPVSSWTPFQSWIISVCSPAVGGACMGFTGMAVKAMSAALFHSDWKQLANYPFYIYFAISAVFVMGQVRYLNTGLRFYDAMGVVPVFEAAIILSNSMAGIVYFRDLREAPDGKKVMFAAGALLAIVGVNIQLLKPRKLPIDQQGKGAAAVSDEEASDDVPLLGTSDPVSMLRDVAVEGMHMVGGGGSKSARRRTSSQVIEMK